jgi:hypothetical protein
MAFAEELSPVPPGRLAWSIRRGSLAGDTEGYRTYILYSDRASKSILLYQKLNEGFLFSWVEILLALCLLFDRPSSACTMIEGRESGIAMICHGSVCSRNAFREAFRRYLTGSVHVSSLW